MQPGQHMGTLACSYAGPCTCSPMQERGAATSRGGTCKEKKTRGDVGHIRRSVTLIGAAAYAGIRTSERTRAGGLDSIPRRWARVCKEWELNGVLKRTFCSREGTNCHFRPIIISRDWGRPFTLVNQKGKEKEILRPMGLASLQLVAPLLSFSDYIFLSQK
jgi:hypothetical protein